MNDRSGGASALLGMDGFVVLSATESEDELWLVGGQPHMSFGVHPDVSVAT